MVNNSLDLGPSFLGKRGTPFRFAGAGWIEGNEPYLLGTQKLAKTPLKVVIPQKERLVSIFSEVNSLLVLHKIGA